MADTWSYEGSLTWDGAAGAATLEMLPVMLTRNVATFTQADALAQAPSSGLAVLLERVAIPLEAKQVRASSVKLITGIWPIIRGTIGETVQVYLGAQEDTPMDNPTYTGPFDYVIGTTEFIDTLVSGRYACVKFTSSGTSPWTLIAYDIDFEEIGVQ